MGKRLREAAYRIWEAHKDTEVMGSKAATIMTIRQFACIDVGCTMPQAERYVRLVRYVERGGAASSWERVDELVERYPRGLMQVRLDCGAAVARSSPPDRLHLRLSACRCWPLRRRRVNLTPANRSLQSWGR